MPTLECVTEVAFVGGGDHLSQAFQYRSLMSKYCWDKARVGRSPCQGANEIRNMKCEVRGGKHCMPLTLYL